MTSIWTARKQLNFFIGCPLNGTRSAATTDAAAAAIAIASIAHLTTIDHGGSNDICVALYAMQQRTLVLASADDIRISLEDERLEEVDTSP